MTPSSPMVGPPLPSGKHTSYCSGKVEYRCWCASVPHLVIDMGLLASTQSAVFWCQKSKIESVAIDYLFLLVLFCEKK